MKYFVWCHSSRELSLRRSKHTARMTHVISAEEPRPPQRAARGLWHGLNQVKFSSPRARVRRSGDV